jgi:predicted CXXCH cytochrome family protein
MCHNSDNWLNAAFNHANTGFPLTGAHTSVVCASCHKNGFNPMPSDCNSCHAPEFASAASPNHAAAGMPVLCETCHTTTAWKPGTFSHTSTGFALTGGHQRVAQCSDCHKGTLLTARQECLTCHQVQYDNAKDHKSQSYPTDCKMCHSSENWLNASFNHANTGFPLTGSHTSVVCASCHKNGFGAIPSDCNSCHAPKFAAAAAPNHTAAGIPVLCEECHTTTAWKPGTFNHTTTGFALTGGHLRVVQCSSCHKGSVTTTRPECLSCHQVQYDNARNHKAQLYPTDCKVCHNSDNWLNATFNHALTAFPLTGSHTSVQCASCHKNGYNAIPTDCNSCHAAKFTSAAAPNHAAAGIPVLCETCHNTTAWKPGTFNHTTTGFALTGGHLRVGQCSACHKGTLLTARPECLACHQVQYDNARNHKSQAYPTDCKMCHNSDNWLNAAFNHANTGFPLTGAHTPVACATCHKTGFNPIPSDCNSCHAAKFSSAASPNHTAAGIPVLCEDCHSTTAWKPGTFNHTTTGFALTGGHLRVVQCSSCHKGSVTTTRPECLSCHQVQYDNAKDHKAQSYPTDCKMCHSSDNWLNASFNHASTSFPLTGAHISVLCASCHKTGYNNTPATCVACHQDHYNAAVNPNHKTLGLSVNCGDCHTTNPNWQPATFAVHNTYYPLTGAHGAVATNCALCHKGNYTTTPNTCFGCHSADYSSSTNPNHATAQFPTNCESCHSVTAWTPSTFNHDSQYFRIYSGEHRGEWTLCSQCHTTPSNFKVFSCLTCHEHNKTDMDKEHQGETGYSYTSSACLGCHPRV